MSGLQLRGEAPETERLTPIKSYLVHNLGGYPGEMVSFVSILGTEIRIIPLLLVPCPSKKVQS